jgi:uncharacterized protein (DUF433 family)
MDWSGCELVEVVPGKVSGQPIVRGTRILADTIVEDHELGSPIEEIAENYPALSTESIRALLSFAQAHRSQPAR